MGFLCAVCCAMLCIMAYMGYKVDSGIMDEIDMLPFGLIFAAVILSAVIVVSRYISTKAKMQENKDGHCMQIKNLKESKEK